MENRLAKIRLGILGGGQLARMLALEAHKLGIKPYVLSTESTDPAAQVAFKFIKGSSSSQRNLKKILEQVDLAIFENEFINPVILQSASLETNTPIHPKPKIMATLQDRFEQKKLLEKNGIPTARFSLASSYKQIQTLYDLFPGKIVLKKQTQGYDGYGTLIADSKKNKNIQDFIKKNKSVLVEEFIPFKREMALILARNRKKQIVELPLVETYQKNSCCVWVKGPYRHPKKSALVKKLKALLNTMNYEGVIAFELFETAAGEFLVNELAPRVHNSGHYSLDALSENQFSLHIRAVLNLDIQAPLMLTNGFAMLNLLGQKTATKWLPPKSTKLHWYGKQESRPGRKMGHINNLDTSPNKALAPLLVLKEKFYQSIK